MRILTHLLIACLLVTVFVSPVAAQPKLQDWEESGCVVDGVPTLKCLEVVYDNILLVSSGLVMMVLFCMLVYGGFVYLTSFGNADKIAQGANIIKWALIGAGLFAGSYIILQVIDTAFLGGKGSIFKLRIPGPGE